MKATFFTPNHMISDDLTGFLAVAASVIMQAVEDVRIYLAAPHFAPGKCRRRINDVKCREDIRATRAREAAHWLKSQECLELQDMLAACGHPVPMKRFFRELSSLKKQQP
jgi:hypothetical protein